MTRSACLKSSAIESLNRNTSRLMCGQLPEAGTYDPLPTWRTKRSYPRVLKVWGPRKSTWVSETPASFILFIPQCRLNENYNGKCFDVSMSHDTSFQRVRYEEYKEYAVKKTTTHHLNVLWRRDVLNELIEAGGAHSYKHSLHGSQRHV